MFNNELHGDIIESFSYHTCEALGASFQYDHPQHLDKGVLILSGFFATYIHPPRRIASAIRSSDFVYIFDGSIRRVIFQIHLPDVGVNGHYITACIDVDNQKRILYDPLGVERRDRMIDIKWWMQLHARRAPPVVSVEEEHNFVARTLWELENKWEDIYYFAPNIPKQIDGWSCGVFCCLAIGYFIRGTLPLSDFEGVTDEEFRAYLPSFRAWIRMVTGSDGEFFTDLLMMRALIGGKSWLRDDITRHVAPITDASKYVKAGRAQLKGVRNKPEDASALGIDSANVDARASEVWVEVASDDEGSRAQARQAAKNRGGGPAPRARAKRGVNEWVVGGDAGAMVDSAQGEKHKRQRVVGGFGDNAGRGGRGGRGGASRTKIGPLNLEKVP